MILDYFEKNGNDLYGQMTDYINQKYKSDNFTFVREFGGRWGSPVIKTLFRSDKYPELPVCVMCDKNDDDNYFDNYMAVKYNNTTFNTILDILKGLYGDKVFLCYEAPKLAFTEGSRDDMSFEEYAKELTSAINFTAITEYDTSKEIHEETISKLKDALSNNGISCCGKIYYANDGADFSDLTFENYYYTYLEKETYNASFSFIFDVEKGYLKNDWQVVDNA